MTLVVCMAVEVAVGSEMGCQVRTREFLGDVTFQTDTLVVFRGEPFLTKNMKAAIACIDPTTGEQVGYVYEGEKVVTEA